MWDRECRKTELSNAINWVKCPLWWISVIINVLRSINWERWQLLVKMWLQSEIGGINLTKKSFVFNAVWKSTYFVDKDLGFSQSRNEKLMIGALCLWGHLNRTSHYWLAKCPICKKLAIGTSLFLPPPWRKIKKPLALSLLWDKTLLICVVVFFLSFSVSLGPKGWRIR